MINGVDMATLGFRLARATGWKDAPGRTRATAVRPTRAGALAASSDAESPRTITLDGTIIGADADAARTAIDQVRATILRTQPAELILPDNPTRYLSAWLDGHTVDAGQGPSMIQRMLSTRISLTALDPYAYDLVAQTITLGAGVNRAPLGTAPSFPVITISGAATNPILTLKRWDGATLATLGLTLTTIGGDTLVVDMGAKTILKNGASVLASLSSGDFFALHPSTAQQNFGALAAEQPYVTTSSGAGTTVYRRAWR